MARIAEANPINNIPAGSKMATAKGMMSRNATPTPTTTAALISIPDIFAPFFVEKFFNFLS
jgi:hypothetical protein